MNNFTVELLNDGVLSETVTASSWKERGHINLPIIGKGTTTISLRCHITDAVHELFEVIVSEYPEWDAYADYQKGDRVTHNGNVYEALQPWFQGYGDPEWQSGNKYALWVRVDDNSNGAD